jgi:hypothetical protein
MWMIAISPAGGGVADVDSCGNTDGRVDSIDKETWQAFFFHLAFVAFL